MDGTFEEIASGPFTRESQPREVYEENLSDLAKIAGLCRERQVPLIVVFHPTYSQIAPEDRAAIREDVTALGVPFYDWSEDMDSAGIQPELHFYDPGHLNREGAARFSAWLGGFFTGELGLAPRPQDPENTAAWSLVAQARQG